MKIMIMCKFTVLRETFSTIATVLNKKAVVLEARNIEQALHISHHNNLDLAILSLKTLSPQCLGPAHFKTKYPKTPVVVLTDSYSNCDIPLILASGARGVISTTSSFETVLYRLRDIIAGNFESSRTQRGTHYVVSPHSESDRRTQLRFNLTVRQLQILKLMQQGAANRDIAQLLRISEGTVKNHCTTIFKSLGVDNRLQAAMFADTILQRDGDQGDETKNISWNRNDSG